jgi:hypothetical protein
MAFTPVSLPIQEILLTNFVTDIATISNANDLLLQAKLEDLINNLEIDVNSLSIGTDNAINFIKTQSVILQDQGIIYQTGTPNQIIAKLEKNGLNESIFTVDLLNVNAITSLNELNVNDMIVTDASSFNGPSEFNSTVNFKSSVIESKESVVLDLAANGSEAKATITLTNTSRQNIFVKLKAVTSPNIPPVYDGVGNIIGTITNIALYIDFDATNPPAPNARYTIHIVDVVEDVNLTSILTAVNGASLPVYIKAGTNQNTSSPIILHDGSFSLGVNPASTVIPNTTLSAYGSNASLLYILDELTNDRLLITGAVGMEQF